MSDDAGLDTDEVIDAVSSRASVIECLMDGPKYNRDLRDELDVSRSTAYKAISELEDFGLARRGDDGYELTNLGKILFEQYQQFYSSAEAICDAGRLLAELPFKTDLPFEFLEAADVYRATRYAPNRPIHEIERIVTESSKVKGTAPVVLPSYVDLFSQQLAAGELEVELLWERPVFEYMRNDYEAAFREAVESGNLSLTVTDDELPFALLLIEEPTQKVAVIFYGSDGNIKGCVLNRTEQAYTWGCEQWEKFQSSATKPTVEETE